MTSRATPKRVGPTYRDVIGAPFRIGTRVRIVKGTDETFNKKFLRKIGEVVHLDYSCKCGQSYPGDPMIGVRFADGTTEEFWAEEIACVNVGK